MAHVFLFPNNQQQMALLRDSGFSTKRCPAKAMAWRLRGGCFVVATRLLSTGYKPLETGETRKTIET
ncbi:hypothetical protein, partial [Ralstonia pseudosolanacearum]|uniref:hypothetical protein n=1 Tax=Ralstonia pseudosolanacearum TaxID=1310165 RepID=UPI003AADF4D4